MKFLTFQVVILSEIEYHWVVLSMNLLILGQTISVLAPVLREGWEVVWTLGSVVIICAESGDDVDQGVSSGSGEKWSGECICRVDRPKSIPWWTETFGVRKRKSQK